MTENKTYEENNILICRGTIKSIKPEHIKKIQRITKSSSTYVVVGYKNQMSYYEDDSYCFDRIDCIKGNYDQYVESLDLTVDAVDYDILHKMKPQILDSMMMQRRFEERTMLRFDKSIKSHYQITLNQMMFWNSFLEQKRIKYVIFSDVAHEAYDNIIFMLCKIKNIRTYIYRFFFKTDRYFLIENYDEMSKQTALALKKLREKNDYVSSEDIILTDSVNVFFEKLMNLQKEKQLFYEETLRSKEFTYRFGETRFDKYIMDCYNRQKGSEKHINNIFKIRYMDYINNYFFILSKKRDTHKFIQQYESLAEKPVSKEKYIYFALHLLPECAVEPLGGIFSNQFFAIKMISSCLPKEWKLYIKMHPAQVCTVMSIEDICEFKKLQNVRIISQDTNQQELIKNSVAVATLTGEVAIEALFYDVPSLIFGYTYYSESPLAITIKTREDVKNALIQIDAGVLKCNMLEKKLYFKALEKVTFCGVNQVIDEIINRIETIEGR